MALSQVNFFTWIRAAGVCSSIRAQRVRRLILNATTIVLLTSPGARAAETIPLTVIDAYSTTALWARVFVDYYIPEVDRRLAESGNFQIKWNKAFGGTVAKTGGVLEALQYNLADIGIITTPFHPDKLPFYNIAYVTPLVTSDVGLVARTVDELVARHPEIAAKWQQFGQVFLTTAGSIDSYQIFVAEQADDLSGYRGSKIAGVGLNLRYLEGIGAVPVSSSLGEFYNNVQTGLTDGALVWAESAVSYKLYEVAPFMLDIRLGAVTSKAISVNERTWNRLPQQVRSVLAEVAHDYRDELAAETERRAVRSREEFEGNGGTIVPVSEAERLAWARSLPNMALEWAATLESQGLPGRQILSEYMDIMRANDQPIVRHWDRE
jgi:TRAP-type C4-dicarboxylate transport system substrate-binding protein